MATIKKTSRHKNNMARKVKEKSSHYNFLGLFTIIILATGTIFYHFQENWSWINSLYFSTITLTTVGFGDLTPTTPISKLFTIFYVLIGIGIIFTFIRRIAKR